MRPNRQRSLKLTCTRAEAQTMELVSARSVSHPEAGDVLTRRT